MKRMQDGDGMGTVNEEMDGKYVGEIVNMKPNGSGIYIYGKGKWEGDKYEGQWKDGEFHGQGVHSLAPMGTSLWVNGKIMF